MSVYVAGLTKSDFVPNIIIEFAGQRFSIRQPDSGLTILPEYNGLIQKIAVNPTSIDPLRPTSTINSSSFTLIDLKQEISKLFLNQNGFRMGQLVRVWLGRSFEAMDFSEYLELPQTNLKAFQKVEGSYNFSTNEKKDRLENGAFNIQSKLANDILINTTTITLQSVPANLPTVGFGKINDEYISWGGISGNNLTSCVRGEFNSIPVEHESSSDFFNIYDITPTNAIDLLAQILISGGGGGSFDVLPEGLGIDENLVDLVQFEEIKTAFFLTRNLSFRIGALSQVQKFLEDEIFAPLGVRLRTNNNGKIGLAVINRNIFSIDAPILNDSNITKAPTFSISEDKIQNRVRIFYNWSDGRNLFLDTYEQEDTDSITEYGLKPFVELRFKGVKNLAFVEAIADLFLARFSTPRADINVEALNETSFLLVGDKTELISDKLPTTEGDLNFISTLEVLKKSYNPATGTVSYQLAFTSFSGLRQCFIAPSETIVNVIDQKTVVLPVGTGSHYREGWVMQLYDTNTRDFVPTERNVIESISGDTITFVNNWVTTLGAFNFKIKFAPFEEVIEQQKKFCFVSIDSSNFDDGTKPYQITFN